MSAFIDLKGRRFGRLLVMQATSKRSSQGDIYWKCVCDCGKSVVVNGKSLRSSGQKSCGCLQREWADSQHNRRTHDGSKDRLFRVWRGMIDRCYYPSHNRYPDYGGRGIYICSEWRHDYAAFREWAMKNGSAPCLHYSIGLEVQLRREYRTLHSTICLPIQGK